MIAGGLCLRGTSKNYTGNQNTLYAYFYDRSYVTITTYGVLYTGFFILKSKLSGIILILQLKRHNQSG